MLGFLLPLPCFFLFNFLSFELLTSKSRDWSGGGALVLEGRFSITLDFSSGLTKQLNTAQI